MTAEVLPFARLVDGSLETSRERQEPNPLRDRLAMNGSVIEAALSCIESGRIEKAQEILRDAFAQTVTVLEADETQTTWSA